MPVNYYRAPSRPSIGQLAHTLIRSPFWQATIFSIGQVARIFHVSPQTIRYYEKEGMIIPIRTGGGTRRYVVDDLVRLRRIRELIVEEGLNVAGIRHMLAMLPCWELRACSPREQARCWQLGEDRTPCWTNNRCASNHDWMSCRSCPVYVRAFDFLVERRALHAAEPRGGPH